MALWTFFTFQYNTCGSGTWVNQKTRATLNVFFFSSNWLVLTDCFDLTRKEIAHAIILPYLATGNGKFRRHCGLSLYFIMAYCGSGTWVSQISDCYDLTRKEIARAIISAYLATGNGSRAKKNQQFSVKSQRHIVTALYCGLSLHFSMAHVGLVLGWARWRRQL